MKHNTNKNGEWSIVHWFDECIVQHLHDNVFLVPVVLCMKALRCFHRYCAFLLLLLMEDSHFIRWYKDWKGRMTCCCAFDACRRLNRTWACMDRLVVLRDPTMINSCHSAYLDHHYSHASAIQDVGIVVHLDQYQAALKHSRLMLSMAVDNCERPTDSFVRDSRAVRVRWQSGEHLSSGQCLIAVHPFLVVAFV